MENLALLGIGVGIGVFAGLVGMIAHSWADFNRGWPPDDVETPAKRSRPASPTPTRIPVRRATAGVAVLAGTPTVESLRVRANRAQAQGQAQQAVQPAIRNEETFKAGEIQPVNLPSDQSARTDVLATVEEVNRMPDFTTVEQWEKEHGPARKAPPIMRYSFKAMEEANTLDPEPKNPVAWWAMYIRLRIWIGYSPGTHLFSRHQQIAVPARYWKDLQPVLRALGIAWRLAGGVRATPEGGFYPLNDGSQKDRVWIDAWMQSAPPIWAREPGKPVTDTDAFLPGE